MNRSDLLTPHLPTDARPGSRLKVAVMRRRYRLGLPLFDPRDRLYPRCLPAAEKPRPAQRGGRATAGRVRPSGRKWRALVGATYLGHFATRELALAACEAHLKAHPLVVRESSRNLGPQGRVYLICGKWMAWHGRTCFGRFPTEAAGWFAVEAHVASLSAEKVHAA